MRPVNAASAREDPRTLLTVAVILILAGGLAALYQREQPIQLRSLVSWKPLNSARDVSDKTGRPVLYFFLQKHDLASRRIEREVLSDPGRSRAINASFVPTLVVDLKNTGAKNPAEVDGLETQFGVSDLPAAVIVTGKGDIRRYRLDKRLDAFLREVATESSPARSGLSLRRARASSDSESLSGRLELLARIGRAYSASFAPDGARVAFVSDLSGSPQVWTVPTSGGWPTAVTSLDEPVGGALWSPTANQIALVAASGNGSTRQIYIADPAGTNLRRITDGVANNWLGFWTRDGTRLMISSNRRDPSVADPYLADTLTGSIELISRGLSFGMPTDVSRDGRYALLFRATDRNDDNLYLVDRVQKRETLLTPHKVPSKVFGQFAFDGRSVYLASDEERDLSVFTRLDLMNERVGGQKILASRPDAGLESFALNTERTMAALLWNVAGHDELWIVDLPSGSVVSRPELPFEIASDLSFSRDSRFLVLTISGARAPSDIWTLNVKNGRFRQITESAHVGVDLTSLVRPTLVRFPAEDGEPLSAWFYQAPEGGSRGAVVLSFHGGPASQEQPMFNSEYQSLLAAGISVYAPNVRGSSGFGKRFESLDNGPLRRNAIRDIKASFDFVVRSGIGDPKKIGIMGASYGGYLVMSALTEYPDLFAAAVEVSGFADFESFFAHTEPSIAKASASEFGDPATQADLLRALSPIHKIERVRAPVLVIHGAKDSNVPVSEADRIVESLRRHGSGVDYLMLVDEGHLISKPQNRARATVAAVNWFQRYLRGSTTAPIRR